MCWISVWQGFVDEGMEKKNIYKSKKGKKKSWQKSEELIEYSSCLDTREALWKLNKTKQVRVKELTCQEQ